MEPVAELLPPGVSVQAELDALNIMLPARTDTPTFGSVLALTSVLGAFIAGITMTVLFGYVALNLLVSLEASSPLTLPLLIVTFVGGLYTLHRSVSFTLRRLGGFRKAYEQHRSTFRLGPHTLQVPRRLNRTESIELSEVLFFDKGPPLRAQLKSKRSVVFAADRSPEAQAWLASACQAVLNRRGDAAVGTEAIPKALQALAQQHS